MREKKYTKQVGEKNMCTRNYCDQAWFNYWSRAGFLIWKFKMIWHLFGNMMEKRRTMELTAWGCGQSTNAPFSPFVPSEEAVNEVKRQAMSELQKAVSDAERKAHEMISAERSKMERALAEAKRQASEDALTIINQQEDSSEVSTYHRPLQLPIFYPSLLHSSAALSHVIYYPSLCFLYPPSYLL